MLQAKNPPKLILEFSFPNRGPSGGSAAGVGRDARSTQALASDAIEAYLRDGPQPRAQLWR